MIVSSHFPPQACNAASAQTLCIASFDYSRSSVLLGCKSGSPFYSTKKPYEDHSNAAVRRRVACSATAPTEIRFCHSATFPCSGYRTLSDFPTDFPGRFLTSKRLKTRFRPFPRQASPTAGRAWWSASQSLWLPC
ncbi:hypothetical protein CLOM_g18754 [Closterium sp. NIES-68]|nr:hypothetical protein CLOM_g18754 [Closterium sp. NIES-68]GJP74780.1 hypothetical protein CLOP_g5318 [Closterium sp. NIES-67]